MSVIVRHLGLQDYLHSWQQMQQFNQQRDESTTDEIWLLQHPPVYTLGLNGKKEHVLNIGDIPLVETDRGGQVTYHGPGQLIAYFLFDIRRNRLGVRQMVSHLEQAVIDLLAEEGIVAAAKKTAPGVYVEDKKIAALGLRIKQGGSYHGLSLNVDMDLSPFKNINPCGYEGMEVTSLEQLGLGYTMPQIEARLLQALCQQFDLVDFQEIHESE
ncbi:MAG: lipoyl(octanoyl) transferase LipB [Gammaproteobacteria bacterium]|nr:lipoyl(octanoyl) transferase LipB [Gammaproteobacteria bacterium]